MTRSRAFGAFLLLSSSLLACGPSRYARGGAVGPLAVTTVDWNPAHVDVGKVAAVAESGEELAVFGDHGASVFAGGALIATDASVTAWTQAAAIPAPDGNGSWIVAIDGNGRLHRMRGRSVLEDVSARWGLSQARVLDVASMGLGRVIFAVDQGASSHAVALADGDRVARIDLPFTRVVGGGGRAAGLGDVAAETPLLRALRPSRDVDETWSLRDAELVAMDGSGRLYAATPRAVYREDDSGRLHEVFEATVGPIHGLAASDGRVWFAEGAELGIVEHDRVAATTGANVDAKAKLVASPTGDVWAIGASGALTRYGTVRAASAWQASIAPIQARVCGGCHGPNGSAGVDLSSAARWDGKRAAITKRVLEEKSMPPPGADLTDDERRAIAAWAKLDR